MSARRFDWAVLEGRCPGRDRCRPESRCTDHQVDVDPESVGELLARLFPSTTAPVRRG